MLESLGFGYGIVVLGAFVYFALKVILGGLSSGMSKLAEKPKRRSSEDEAYEALHCKPGEHVYAELKTKRYSENNDGTDIRMDEKGELYLMVYNMKTGEAHRLSSKNLVYLQDMMESTFKTMAENEKAMKEKGEKLMVETWS